MHPFFTPLPINVDQLYENVLQIYHIYIFYILSVEPKEIVKKEEDDSHLYTAPTLPFEKPIMKDIEYDSFTLSWQPATYPDWCKKPPIQYMVERRTLPSLHWKQLQTGIPDISFPIKEYDVKKDYMYRVTAFNDYGVSEPTGAVSAYAKTGTTFTNTSTCK